MYLRNWRHLHLLSMLLCNQNLIPLHMSYSTNLCLWDPPSFLLPTFFYSPTHFFILHVPWKCKISTRLSFFFVIVNKMLKLNKEIGDYSQVKDVLTFNHQGVLLATYNNSISKLIVSEFNYILFNIMHKIKLFTSKEDVDVKRKLDGWLLFYMIKTKS
jgi:hypothetical protein